jgi:Caspase domain
LNENATEAGIAAAFEHVSKVAKPQDVFVLFLSGHGRSIAGKGWYFLPPNLEQGQRIEDFAIGQDKLQKWLSQVPAQKSVIILDACEAGASEAFRSVDRERETVIAQLEHATGRNTIAAAAQGKAAYEGYQDHGVLTYAILEALNRDEKAKEDVVDLYTVGGYISRRVPEISLQQFNMYQQPKADLKDNFPLGKRQPLLKTAAIACKLTGPSEGPSHIVASNIEVREKPDGSSPVTIELKRNALVTVKACDGSWALLARGGKDIGYARYSILEPVN